MLLFIMYLCLVVIHWEILRYAQDDTLIFYSLNAVPFVSGQRFQKNVKPAKQMAL